MSTSDIESMFASMPPDDGDRRSGSNGSGGSGGFLDKLPPQDLGAEQSVLGGMLLSKDAIADVGESVRSNDFYKPAHENIYDAIVSLYGRGEPADAITVGDELTKRGDIGRIGENRPGLTARHQRAVGVEEHGA